MSIWLIQYNTVQYSIIQYNTAYLNTWHRGQDNKEQCIIIEYNTVQCSTMQYNAVQCSTIQYNTVQYSIIQYNATCLNTWHRGQDNKEQCIIIQYNTVQYSTMQYNTVQCSTIQYNTVQYSTIQYNTVQYNTIQYKYSTMQHTWRHDTGSRADAVGHRDLSIWRRHHVVGHVPGMQEGGTSLVLPGTRYSGLREVPGTRYSGGKGGTRYQVISWEGRYQVPGIQEGREVPDTRYQVMRREERYQIPGILTNGQQLKLRQNTLQGLVVNHGGLEDHSVLGRQNAGFCLIGVTHVF